MQDKRWSGGISFFLYPKLRDLLMIFPNKFTTLDESLLARAPLVLGALESPKSPSSLFDELASSFEDVGEFILTLDLLYLISLIEINSHNQISKS